MGIVSRMVRLTAMTAIFATYPFAGSAQGVDHAAVGWGALPGSSDVPAGSGDEDRLLVLQLLGRVPRMPTGVRRFTPLELDSMITAVRRDTSDNNASALRAELLSFRAALQVNSTHPFSENDGAMWAGKGVTLAAATGAAVRWRWFSAAIRPQAFWTQNAAYTPELNAVRAPGDFTSPSYPGDIDLPYRFGPRSYARLDPGESWLRGDTRWLSAGFSTTAETWGPAHVYPLLMSANAGGFPHAFIESGLPWNLWVGHLAVRTIVGKLQPSSFDPGKGTDRLGAGLVASFIPRWLDGVEVGGGRFMHRTWAPGNASLTSFKVPFEGLFKSSLSLAELNVVENQLLSVFFRLAPPQSGAELYGEFLRDDHNFDVRDFLLEPDHESAYLLGLRKAWASSDTLRSTVATLEIVNGRISHLARVRTQSAMYVHTQLVEGHTLHGQLLGANPAFGGSGYIVKFDRFVGSGTWELTQGSQSIAQNQEGGLWNGERVGFSFLGLEHAWNSARMHPSLGGNLQFPWNSLAGGTNLSLFLSVRSLK